MTDVSLLVPRDREEGDSAVALDILGETVRVKIPASGGVEVLRDWTSVNAQDTELSAGIDFGVSGFSGVTLEIRKLNYSGSGSGDQLPSQGNLTLVAYRAGRVQPDTIYTSGSVYQSRGNPTGGSKAINKANLTYTSFGMYDCTLEASLHQTPTQVGYSARYSFLDSNSGLVGMVDAVQVTSFSDATSLPTELWLTGKTGETLDYEYRIIRK